jgi:hypothetical protein
MKSKTYNTIGVITGALGLLMMIMTPGWFGGDFDVPSWVASLVLVMNFFFILGVSRGKEDRRQHRTLLLYVTVNFFAVSTIAFWTHTDDCFGTVTTRLELLLANYTLLPFWNVNGEIFGTISFLSSLLMLAFEAIAIWKTYSKKGIKSLGSG